MAYIFCDSFLSGKSYAAKTMCYATMSDRLIVTELAGGAYETMRGASEKDTCANYSPLTAALLLEDVAANHPEALVEEAQDKFNAHVARKSSAGSLLSFDDGSYVSTILVGLVSEEGVCKCLPYDKRGKLTTDLDKAVYFFLYDDQRTKEVFGHKVPEWYRFVFDARVMLDKGLIELEGLPYVRVIESAVEFPEFISYPVYNSSPFSQTLEGMIAEALKKKASLQFLKDAQHDKHLQDNPEITEASDELLAIASMAARLNARGRVSQLFPTPFAAVRKTDSLYLPTKDGKLEERHVRVAAFIFRLSRCIIDSISSLPQTLEGNALSGGTSGGMLRLLQACQESEAILYYVNTAIKKNSNSVAEDPLGKIQGLGGYVNGYVYTQKLEDGGYLSQQRWFITSRDANAGHRTTPFLLWDPKRKLTLGRHTYSIDGRVYWYSAKGKGNPLDLQGPFDPSLSGATLQSRLKNHFPGRNEEIEAGELGSLRGQTNAPRKQLSISDL